MDDSSLEYQSTSSSSSSASCSCSCSCLVDSASTGLTCSTGSHGRTSGDECTSRSGTTLTMTRGRMDARRGLIRGDGIRNDAPSSSSSSDVVGVMGRPVESREPVLEREGVGDPTRLNEGGGRRESFDGEGEEEESEGGWGKSRRSSISTQKWASEELGLSEGPS
jgi:hypothetical protein